MLGKAHPWSARYGMAIVAVVVAAGIKLLLEPIIQEESPFLLFFAAVMISGAVGGFGPGILATLLAAAVSGYLFFAPVGEVLSRSAGENLRLLIFVVEGVIITAISSSLVSARRELFDTVERLRVSEERNRKLAEGVVKAEGVSEGIALIEDGDMIETNERFAQMFGYDPDEVLGVSASEFVSPEDRKIVAEHISSGDVEPYEIRGLKKDGTVFPLEVRPRLIPYYGREVLVTSVIDITNRKREEEDLRRQLRQEHERADELEEELESEREKTDGTNADAPESGSGERSPLTRLFRRFRSR